MKKNILLSGILLLSFSCAVAQDYHDDVVVLDSVKVMSFNIRFNNPNDSLDTSWDRRREPCTRMMAQYRPDVVGMQEPRNEMWQQIFDMLPDYGYYRIEMNDTHCPIPVPEEYCCYISVINIQWNVRDIFG